MVDEPKVVSIFGPIAENALPPLGQSLQQMLSATSAAFSVRDVSDPAIEALAKAFPEEGAGPLRVEGALVALRRQPFLSTRIEDSAPAWSSGLRVDRRIGPVIGTDGRPVWVDIFHRVRQLRFVRSPGGLPFLTLPIVQVGVAIVAAPLRAGRQLPLAKGSLWFASNLVSAAPVGTYTGIRIKKGRIVFSADVALGDDEVVVPPGVTIDVSLDFDAPDASPTVAGSEFAAASADFPKGLDLVVNAGGATLSVRGDAALTAWGTTVAMSPAAETPVYRADINRLIVPMKPVQPELEVIDVASVHFVPAGKAPVTGAALALTVATIAASDLGEAAGVGALMLGFDSGLKAKWAGASRAVALDKSFILLDATRLAFTADAVRATGEGQRLRLATDPATDIVHLRRDLAPVNYFTGPDGNEFVVTQAMLEVRPPVPVTVTGDRVELRLPQAIVVIMRGADATETFSAFGFTAPSSADRPLAFALTNAVLRAGQPFGAYLSGRVDAGALVEGTLLVGHRLSGLLPSLPDPYAASIELDRRFGARDRGILVSNLRWGPGGRALTFALPGGATFDVGGGSPAMGLATNQFKSNAFLGDLVDFERQPKVILLDVSTAASRLGVALRPPSGLDRDSIASIPLKAPQITGLDLAVDGRMMVLLTLPSVQWEPVRNVPPPPPPPGEPPPEPFPDEVRFANSGVPTVVDVASVELVPVTPLAAYGEVLRNFAAPAPRPARARFTLPFGMLAGARLAAPSGGRGATVGEARPTTADGMEGAHQIRIDAVDPTLAPGETPALPGATLQLPVALPTDGTSPRSILGSSVTTTFNAALGPSGTDPLVPVTRIDLAGHGASMMSAWANPDDPETGVVKAEFQVLNGRAAHEVVQIKSILLPYFTPVVRTITLERRGNAVFTREDSGWVSVRDGIYRASPGSGIETHPGCVTRASRISNIRETGTTETVAGFTYVAVRFDTDLILEGAAGPVPARRQEGWVKLSTVDLTPSAYAALIDKVGPMGGAIDAVIAPAGGRHRMRLHRVGVGVAGPQFAMAAWGSLAFPGGGDWSVMEAPDGVEAPVIVADDRGLPLIRQGVAGVASTAPWRFADPEDLFDPTTPARDYGILHSMGTQRAFFRRPRIEAAAPNRIVSTERPVLADPLVLATSTGPFPRQADAIPFPSAAYALEVRPDASWHLDGPDVFPAGVARRTIRTAGTVRSDLDYSAATVTYRFDTAQLAPWTFKLDGAKKVMAHTTMGDLITMVAQIEAEAGRPTVFADPQMLLGGPFEIVQDLLTIMQDLGIPARPDVQMTNAWSLKVTVNVPFVDAAGDDYQVPPVDPNPTIIFADCGAKVSIKVAPDMDSAEFELGGSPMFAIKAVPGLYVVAIIKFKIQMSTKEGTTYGVLIGVGIAYKLKAKPFEFKGLFALTFFAVFGDTVLGYGVGFLLKLEADLPPIISIELSLEGKLARLLVQDGTPNETVFQIAKLVFAIEVSIFMVFSISFELETKKVEVIRGPLLESDAPDVL